MAAVPGIYTWAVGLHTSGQAFQQNHPVPQGFKSIKFAHAVFTPSAQGSLHPPHAHVLPMRHPSKPAAQVRLRQLGWRGLAGNLF